MRTFRQKMVRIARASSLAMAALLLASCAQLPGNLGGESGDNQTSQSLVQLGDATRGTGDLTGAVRLYRRALAEKPDQVDVWMLLAATLLQGGDPDEAVQAYDKALSLAPQRADAHVGLGRVYLATRKFNQAQVEFTAALKLQATNVQAWNDFGVALDLLGRHEDAQVKYTKGLEIAPDDPTLRSNLGLSLALTGDYDEAVTELSGLSLEPSSTPRIRQNLALALALKGDDKEAERLLRIDLDEQAVKEDLRYFATLRQLADAAKSAPPVQQRTAANVVPVTMTAGEGK